MDSLRQQFIEFSIQTGVLRFGSFVTKAGRTSPYFFNAGLFCDGASLGRLADFYAQTLLDSGVQFDMLYGPFCLQQTRRRRGFLLPQAQHRGRISRSFSEDWPERRSALRMENCLLLAARPPVGILACASW